MPSAVAEFDHNPVKLRSSVTGSESESPDGKVGVTVSVAELRAVTERVPHEGVPVARRGAGGLWLDSYVSAVPTVAARGSILAVPSTEAAGTVSLPKLSVVVVPISHSAAGGRMVTSTGTVAVWAAAICPIPHIKNIVRIRFMLVSASDGHSNVFLIC